MKTIMMLMVVILSAGCSAGQQTDETNTDERSPVELISVIDGDTIKVLYNGQEETVRYLLIDTPETHHQELATQPFGEEATLANKTILKSSELEIEFDEGRRLDDYGRLLAYVYADGEIVQKQLLEEGLARVAYVFPPNTRYLGEFERSERKAQEKRIGVWKTKNYVTDRGFNSEVIENPERETKSNCDIKGNINRKGDKIYHLPSGMHYEQTNPEEWFCSEQEAKNAGYRNAGQ